MNNIVVLGANGYIGKEFCYQALNKGYNIIGIDRKFDHRSVLYHFENFHDITEDIALNEFSDSFREIELLCNGNPVTAIVCFAAYKDLPGSYEVPLEYYNNNLNIVINSWRLAEYLHAKKFIFSSSAAVYSSLDLVVEGNDRYFPESAKLLGIVSPYGMTKRIGENIIFDASRVSKIEPYALRYFNPIGKTVCSCDESDSLFGNIKRCIKNGDTLKIFGSDYPTKDGTCIRDYIDLRDLVNAHLFICENNVPGNCYNIGTGNGTSVLEVANAVKDVVRNFKYEITERRAGDDAGGYAKSTLIKYGWKCYYSLVDSIRTLI